MITSRCKKCRTLFPQIYPDKRFCSIICANRYNLNRKHSIVLPNYSRDLAEFIGIMLGDGSVNKYFSRIYLNAVADRDYVSYVFEFAQKLFGKTVVTQWYNPRHHTAEIQMSSVMVSDFLTKQGIRGSDKKVPAWIFENTEYSMRCVRGLFDTDGAVGKKNYTGRQGVRTYKQLTFTNTNENLKSFVRATLSHLGYSPTQGAGKNIYISNRFDIRRYLETIGSRNPKILQALHD